MVSSSPIAYNPTTVKRRKSARSNKPHKKPLSNICAREDLVLNFIHRCDQLNLSPHDEAERFLQQWAIAHSDITEQVRNEVQVLERQLAEKIEVLKTLESTQKEAFEVADPVSSWINCKLYNYNRDRHDGIQRPSLEIVEIWIEQMSKMFGITEDQALAKIESGVTSIVTDRDNKNKFNEYIQKIKAEITEVDKN